MFQKSVLFKWVHAKMFLSVSFLVGPYKSVSSFHFWWTQIWHFYNRNAGVL